MERNLLIQRPRRLRENKTLRRMVREVSLDRAQLIYPLFVREGIPSRQEVKAMPGIFQLSLSEAVREARECWDKGIGSVILFGIPSKKDTRASEAYNKNGIVQNALRAIKEACPELVVMTDVCLCEYMEHGHCGVVVEKPRTGAKRQGTDYAIDNDATLELLAQTALSHAEAGADLVAPSDMMDGRVKAIRRALDESGRTSIPIMSYAVKYASSLYGPFRDAAGSVPEFGDRRSYQMDFANTREAIREIRLDEEEGADIILIKPAMPCLDIISRVSLKTNLPIAAYQVSGEYAMICAAAQNGWIDRSQVIVESLTAIKRAGARLIVTYFAKEIGSKGLGA